MMRSTASRLKRSRGFEKGIRGVKLESQEKKTKDNDEKKIVLSVQ